MTLAVLLAALAGVGGGAAIVELATGTRTGRDGAAGGGGVGIGGDGAAGGRGVGRAGGGAAAALARLGRRIGAPAAPRDLDARLAAAGAPPWLSPGDVMASKAGAALVAALVAAPLVAGATLRLAVVLLGGAAAAGFLAPDLWLRRHTRRRLARAGLELADVLDLLRVVVEAGLPATRALAEVGRRRGGLVGTELRAASARIELGTLRGDALALLAARLPLPNVLALVAALERADRHGAPLGPALAALADDARAERARRLHDAAAAAAPRIQLVVAMLLVPAVLLLVAAGLLHGMT